MNCSLNKNHLICNKPVEVKCSDGQIYLACHDCVLKEADYSGLFKCKLCSNEHRINALKPKELASLTKTELKKILRDLLTQGNLINSSLKGTRLGFKQNLKF